MRFSVRKGDEIKKDRESARQHFGEARFETSFLQDGDSFAVRTKDLMEVLTTPRETFPALTPISLYGRDQTMMRKSEAGMQEICDAGLNMLYNGIEPGSDKVLELVEIIDCSSLFLQVSSEGVSGSVQDNNETKKSLLKYINRDFLLQSRILPIMVGGSGAPHSNLPAITKY